MNRECVIPGGAGIYPLEGDVASAAGNNTVKVTGIQSIPVVFGPMVSGQSFQYVSADNAIENILRASIQVNGVTVSDDPLISVNLVKPVTVNGA